MPDPIPHAEQVLRTMWGDDTKSLADIGDVLGCSPTTVTQRANRLNLPRRKVVKHTHWKVKDDNQSGKLGGGAGGNGSLAAGEKSHERAEQRAAETAKRMKRPNGRPKKAAG